MNTTMRSIPIVAGLLCLITALNGQTPQSSLQASMKYLIYSSPNIEPELDKPKSNDLLEGFSGPFSRVLAAELQKRGIEGIIRINRDPKVSSEQVLIEEAAKNHIQGVIEISVHAAKTTTSSDVGCKLRHIRLLYSTNSIGKHILITKEGSELIFIALSTDKSKIDHRSIGEQAITYLDLLHSRSEFEKATQ